MEILSLQLENTKSYTQAQIDFLPGVNAIVGHNGAGKSTILEAIGFALFDSLNYNHKEFVRAGARQATITLTFASHYDERRYQVVRRCGSSTQYLIFDPELQTKICEGKADVLRFLRLHMGVEAGGDLAGIFTDAVGVPQGAFTAVFLQTPVQRKAIFDRLLRVEEYKQAADKLREPQRVLREQQQQLEVQMSALSARLERLPLLEAAIQQRTQQIQQAASQLTSVEVNLQTAQALRTVLEQMRQQLLSLHNRQVQNSQLLRTLEQQQRTSQTALQQAQHAQTLVEQHLAGHDQYQAAQAEQKALEAQLRQRQQIQSQSSTVERTLIALQSNQVNLQRELTEVAAAEQTVATLTAAVQQQETLEQTLAAAKQQSARLQDAQAAVSRQERECQRLEKRVQELTAQLTTAAQLEEHSQASEARIITLRGIIEQQKENLATCKNEADVIKRQDSALQDVTTATCPVCEQALTPDHRRQMLARNSQRLAALRADYKRAQDQLKGEEGRLQTEQAELQRWQQELRRLPRAAELTQAEQEHTTAAATLATLRSQAEALLTAPVQVEQLTAQLAQVGNPRQQFAIANATAQRRPQLEQKQSQLTSELTTQQQQLAAYQQALTQFATLDATVERISHTLHSLLPAYETVLANRQLAATVATRAQEVTTIQQSLVLAQQEAEQITSELAQVEAQFDQQRYEQTISQEQQLRGELGSLRTQIELLRAEQARATIEVVDLTTQQGVLANLKAQQQELTAKENVLTSLRDLLRQAGPQVTKTMIRQVSNGAAQIFCDIMQDYTRHLRWNEDYGIIVEVDGHDRQFAQLSGGEQMSAALALRLALLREMSDIDIAFFDEPTTNLDEARREALARQILEVKGFRQLFVISHDDTFEQATQNLIRVQQVNGISAVME